MKRDPKLYLEDIIDSIDTILSFTSDMKYNDFLNDIRTRWAVTHGLELIGEAAKNMPRDIVANHPEVPWKLMSRMRDRLIHGYFTIDPEILWKTIKEDLPRIRPLIQKILEEISSKT
jgi:uncharacterized protein with HEPN domain